MNKLKVKMSVILIICLLVSFSTPNWAANGSVKLSEVNTVLNTMLQDHYSEHALTPEVLRRTIEYYFTDADPRKVYLTSDDVSPYLNLNDTELAKSIEEIKSGNFKLFVNMQNSIRDAFKRSAALRNSDRFDSAGLLENALKMSAQTKLKDEPYKEYAKNATELNARLQDEETYALARLIQRYGIEKVRAKNEIILKRLDKKFEHTEASYLAKTSEEEFSSNILKAFALALDPHSSFLDSKEAREMRQRLNKGFKGIGITMVEGLDGVTIEHVNPNSPASDSKKILAGDQIVQVNGTSTTILPLEEVVDLLVENGKGTIDLTLLRHEEGDTQKTVNVSLVPRQIEIVDSRVDVKTIPTKDGIIGVIALHAFYDGDNGVNSASDVLNALQELKKKGRLQGLILDLRDNGGGYLHQAVDVAGLFISNGVVVMSRYFDGSVQIYRDLDPNDYYNGPMVVLTSKLTASAAEIVAQTLQDYGVAVVVGDKETYGKGTIQTQNVTGGDEDAFYKVTIGKYYTVSGETPQLKGVKADVVVPSPYSTLQIGEKYLSNPLPSDQIDAHFDDALPDVSGLTRVWMSANYLPTIQKPEGFWKTELSSLNERSQRRIAKSEAYEKYVEESLAKSQDGDVFSRDQNGDLQFAEAVHVVNDMIDITTMTAKAHHVIPDGVGVPTP